MIQKVLYFTAPREVEIREESLLPPGENEVLIKTRYTAISAGTELLVYNGQVPETLTLDESIESLQGNFRFPFKYGYTLVGTIVETGSGVDKGLIGKKVFTFQPHQDYTVAALDSIILLPDDVSPEQALFLPNMETAVNFLMDGAPVVGEVVCLLGQGIVGLLTTFLVAEFPVKKIITLDKYELRRELSLAMGSRMAVDPEQVGPDQAGQWIRDKAGYPADLIFELSGSPEALNTAIELAGFDGRIIIGSWYGTKEGSIELGGTFHRKRLTLKSSQVSTISPHHSGRFSKERRMAIALDHVRKLEPKNLVTHRFPFEKIANAYRHLKEEPESTLQIIIEYPE